MTRPFVPMIYGDTDRLWAIGFGLQGVRVGSTRRPCLKPRAESPKPKARAANNSVSLCAILSNPYYLDQIGSILEAGGW
jgi:hypothetical protein